MMNQIELDYHKIIILKNLENYFKIKNDSSERNDFMSIYKLNYCFEF